jgi:formylmethanofuran dehydrogenase subunit B
MTHGNDRRLPEAYEQMVERAADILGDYEKTKYTLQHVLQEAKNKAIELGELTAEEAAQTAEYIKNDLHDIARNFAENERDFTDWLKLDILLINKRLQ